MKTTIAVVPASLAFAKGLFTPGTDAFGSDEITKALGMTLEQAPPIPFSEQELRRARELDQYLILQVDTAKDAKPLTMKSMHNEFGDGKLLYDMGWYKKEPFFTEDAPAPGWKLVSREVIPGSAGEDYLTQTQAIADYLANEVYKGEELPDEYQAAVDEFAGRKDELEELVRKDWEKAAKELADLKLNRLFREKPVEALYGLILQHEINRERLLGNMWTWTNQRSSDGYLVYVGGCGSYGAGVRGDQPDGSYSRRGVRFFRSAIQNSAS
jgi:hypothetical protein